MQALNEYPGGRQKGLSDLASGSFNASNMTPTFYNLNYTGPAGKAITADYGRTRPQERGILSLTPCFPPTWGLDRLYELFRDR